MARGKKKVELTLEEKLEQALVPVAEQPYEVPGNWCWTTVGTVCVFVNGYAFKSDMFSKEGTPIIRISNIQENEIDLDRCIYTTESDIDDKFVVKKGDLLIAMSGATTGKNGVYISDTKAYLNQRVGNIKVRDEKIVLPLFRNYYIMSMQQEILNSAYGGAQPNISGNKIGEMKFPLPPLTEQQRIVEQIESLFAKLDEAKEKIQNTIDVVEANKSSILQDAFSGKLTESWRREFGCQDEWKEVFLRDILIPVKEKYDPTSDYKLNIPYIGLEHIVKGHGICSTGSSNEVKSLKTLFKKNDLLYGKLRPYLNKHDVADFDGMCSTDILVYRARNPITAKYMNYLFGTIDFMEYAMATSSGINLPRTSEKAISSYRMKISNEDEQTKIVELLDCLLKKEDKVINDCEKILEQIELIKKSILAKAFRGELGTNNSDDESAVELIKKILEQEEQDEKTDR